MPISRPLPGLRRLAWISAAALAGLILVALLRGSSTTAAAGFETVAVERRSFATTVVALGAVKPQIGAEVRVGSRVSGRVERLAANVGDRVERGQVIAQLETAEYQATVAQREAELRLAESRLAAAHALDPEAVARAEAELAQREATALLAAEAWKRFEALLLSGVITRADAEQARERHAVAQAQLEAARRALELVRGGGADQRRQAEAERDRARAALESARVEREFTSIRAPISGVVASVATQEGETVAAGLNAPTFLTIVDLDRLHVEAYVDEVDVGKVAVGQAVSFTVDAYPARDFEGRVVAIYPSATIQDNVVKYVTAVEVTSEYGGLLRPEMTANVRILLESRDVLAVPARSIRREGGRDVVYVLEGGRAEPRPVRIGWRDGAWAEVVEGLEAGQRVLVEPPTQ